MFPALWGFERRGNGDHGARMSSWIKGIIVGSLVGVSIVALIVSSSHDEDPKKEWAWIDVVRCPATSLFESMLIIGYYRSMPSRMSKWSSHS